MNNQAVDEEKDAIMWLFCNWTNPGCFFSHNQLHRAWNGENILDFAYRKRINCYRLIFVGADIKLVDAVI